MAALLVFESDDTSGVSAGSVRCSHLQVHEEIALTRIAIFGDFIIFDGVLVTVGADAPDVHGEDFAVLIEGHGDNALVPALRAEDLDDVAVMLDGAAVWCDGVGGVFEEDDGVGFGSVRRKLLLGGGADPIGNAVRFGCEGRDNGQRYKNERG